MTRFQRIKIGGFRRLYDVDLEMRPVMVMIGANGVGKTSFLDALTVLSASAEGRLYQTLNDMGGVTGILTDKKTNELKFSLSLYTRRPEKMKMEYEFTIRPSGYSYTFASEKFLQTHPVEFKFINVDHGISIINMYSLYITNPWETSLSQLPAQNLPPDIFRNYLKLFVHYHALPVDSNSPIRIPQQLRPSDLPGEHGEYLVPYLYSLKESHTDLYESLEDTLKAAYPCFERLSFPPVAAGMLTMTWKEKDFSTPLYMNQLSDGTLRYLWLASLLHSPALPSVTMIDEPEVSLHPELLEQLVELLREASERTQLIIVTQSDSLVRFLKPEEVVVMDIDENGFATAKWGDTFDLDEWLKEYTLDEVWRMGRMGGLAV